MLVLQRGSWKDRIAQEPGVASRLLKLSFIDMTRGYLGSVLGEGPGAHQGCRAIAGPVAVTNQMEILHRGFAVVHEMVKWAKGRTEASASGQMVVVELVQTVEDGDSGELARAGEFTQMRKRENIPEVRVGIATENPMAAARVKH